MSLYAQVQKNISIYYKKFSKQASAQYAKETIVGFGVFAGLVICYASYSFYAKKREQKAFAALIEVIDSFDKAQQEKHYGNDDQANENSWQDTKILLDALYNQNSHSNKAPYFLMFKSEAALESGASIDEALKIIEEGLEKISKKTVIFELFNLKRILMSFESADENVRKGALHDLIATAQNEKGYFFEQASYELGLYYISQGDMQGAHNVLENLLKNADKQALLPSPWVKLAEEKLESIK